MQYDFRVTIIIQLCDWHMCVRADLAIGTVVVLWLKVIYAHAHYSITACTASLLDSQDN